MSILSRLLGRKNIVEPIVPDDSHLTRTLRTAKRANFVAVGRLQEALKKQTSDAVMAREIIHEVLNRADRVRAIHNASTQE